MVDLSKLNSEVNEWASYYGIENFSGPNRTHQNKNAFAHAYASAHISYASGWAVSNVLGAGREYRSLVTDSYKAIDGEKSYTNTDFIMSRTLIKKASGRTLVVGIVGSLFFMFGWGAIKFILAYAFLYFAIWLFERFHRLMGIPGPFALSRYPKAVFDWLWSGFKWEALDNDHEHK